MSQIVSFEDYTPPARFDSTPWSEVRVEESDTAVLSGATIWTQIDVVPLLPLDVDPAVPASRSFTTDLASSTPDLWYRVTFADAGGGVSLTSVAVQNAEFLSAPYAPVSELLRVLKVRTPTAAQETAAQRYLLAATGEINAEIDSAADATPLADWQLAVVESVCLDRAADLWRHTESAPGVLGVMDEAMVTAMPGRYSWERYAQRLAPLKSRWGFA